MPLLKSVNPFTGALLCLINLKKNGGIYRIVQFVQISHLMNRRQNRKFFFCISGEKTGIAANSFDRPGNRFSRQIDGHGFPFLQSELIRSFF